MRPIVFILLFITVFAKAQTSFQEAQSLFMDSQFEAAEPLFRSHLETNPNHLKTIEYLGDIAGHKKQWDKAINYYKALVKAKPDRANYHYKYGGVMGMQALEVNKLKALGMIGDIKRAFKAAAELDPKHIDVRWALVEFYIQLPGIIGGSERTAISYADELENLSKVDGYLAKGYIAEYSNRPNDAEIYYKKAIEVGGSVTCYQKLTSLYENTTKEPQKAITIIEESQTKHKRNGLHYQIGKVCAKYNVDLDKGIKCLDTYIKNHSSTDGVPKSWAYYRLAQIYKHKGNKDKALKYIDLALSKKPLKPFKKEKQAILLL
ncbi:MAG: tetratricopeptide repeat protein [Flavobacteriaceae bacterium]|nr:tetratricopeptide repeat protein [Flavobacteriaceae bacterium]